MVIVPALRSECLFRNQMVRIDFLEKQNKQLVLENAEFEKQEN